MDPQHRFFADTSVTANVPLLGNRVDRFIWNAAAGP
jgi:hypothetical protein